MRIFVLMLLCAATGWVPGTAVAAATEAGAGIAVKVEIQDDTVLVDVEMDVAATPPEVWEVLTDFDQLPRFLSNLASSKVLAREGNVVRLEQTGKAKFGPFTFKFQSERELTLVPFERLESRMLRGNMKRYHGVTRLEAVPAGTRLRFRSEAVPDTVLPLRWGRGLIERETREHYQEVLREVLRRQASPGR